MPLTFDLDFWPRSPSDVICQLINSFADEVRQKPEGKNTYPAQGILELTVRALKHWVDSMFKPIDAGGGITAGEAAKWTIEQASDLHLKLQTPQVPESYGRFVGTLVGLFSYLTHPVEYLGTQEKKDAYAALLREEIRKLEARI